MILGSIEAGGTKFVCAVGDENCQTIDQFVIPTTSPEETLNEAINYFKQFKIDALGIASFGPIEIRKEHPKYDYITNTPKKNWKDTDILGTLRSYFKAPITWTTDVNGSAYGEYKYLRTKGSSISNLVYYTVGTGIGGGAVVHGSILNGAGHSEMGHTIVKRHKSDEKFEGCCPFHGDCLEGLASGPSFEKRLGIKGEYLEDSHAVYESIAYYLAQAVLQSTLLIRPEKIVFGGSVISGTLLNKIRSQVKDMLNNYIELPPLEEYITQPILENNGSATFGNFALAKQQILY